MELIQNLLETAQYLNLKDIVSEIEVLKDRKENPRQVLFLPIVGEFSSGKTTLINALTNSKKLETASKATTSVIYEIFFGNEKESGEIFYNNGTVKEVEDLKTIKNDELDNVELIRIYDTADTISNTTVIVDTPGLSSNEASHIEALTNYLPNADAILLCTDINQQITQSLLEFIKNTKLSERPIYLIVTKTDTKTDKEVKEVVAYIQKNIELPLENIICISAKDNKLEEFYKLIDQIQQSKNEIINKKITHDLEKIRKNLLSQLDAILKATSSPTDMEEAVEGKEDELQHLKRNITKLSRDVRYEIEGLNSETARQFESNITTRLDNIIERWDTDIDQEAYNAVQSITNLSLAKYKEKVRTTLFQLAQKRKGTEDAIDLSSIENADLSAIQMGELSYNLNLYQAGHGKDKLIAGIAGTVAILGTAGVGATVAAGGIGAALKGAQVGLGSLLKGNTVNLLDTATDLASMYSNKKTRDALKESQKQATPEKKDINEKIRVGAEKVQNFVETANKVTEAGGGFVTKIVGNLTDSFFGKPQRQRAIRDYLNNTLLPEFKENMSYISDAIITGVTALLQQEATSKIEGINQNIQELKQLHKEQQEVFQNKVNRLTELKNKIK
jgi:hypothetical protein